MTKAKGGHKIRPDGKKDTGRPSVMTPETLNALCYAFSCGCRDEEACDYAGIGMSTLYKYQNECPSFVDKKNALKNRPMMHARMNIAKKLEEGDIDTSKWYAERKRKDEFSTRQEFGGLDGQPLTVTLNIEGVSPDEDTATE